LVTAQASPVTLLAPAVAAESEAPTDIPRRAARALRRRRLVPYLVAVDALAFLLTGALTHGLTYSQAVWAVGTMIAFVPMGLYRHRLAFSVLDDLPRLAEGVLFVGGLVGVLAHSQVAGTELGDLGLVGLATGVVAVLAVRIPAYALIRQTRRAGGFLQPVLVVGAGQVGVRLVNGLLADRSYGLYPVGMLEQEAAEDPREKPPVPLLGTPADLRDRIRSLKVKRVIIAFGYQRESDLVEVLRTCDRLNCEIFYVPRLFELNAGSPDLDNVGGIPLVRIRRPAFRSPSWHLKRVTDMALSGALLVLLAPVLAACALAVRFKNGPGVLFRQERVGLDGRPFQVRKFRTLKSASDAEAQTTWNISRDQRLNGVSRFLRATSLDELPQLWNVFIGEMSLVGPRPERPHFVDDFSHRIPRYTGRHRVPAGLTGWSQVNGLRGDTSIEERARYDNYYIENWSLWLDAKILIRTVGEVLARRGG
jgi:exopolysaccharide biosynthesis polyprenyl glycosylphosphotransferase